MRQVNRQIELVCHLGNSAEIGAIIGLNFCFLIASRQSEIGLTDNITVRRQLAKAARGKSFWRSECGWNFPDKSRYDSDIAYFARARFGRWGMRTGIYTIL